MNPLLEYDTPKVTARPAAARRTVIVPLRRATERPEFVTTLVWCVASLLLVRQVLVYGRRIPVGDDWLMLRLLREDLPFHSPETWWIHSDHAIPLAKFAYVALVGGLHDPRAGTWLTVLLLVASAWGCMRAARTLRGRAHVTDALFPLLLLHGGHSANTSSSIQIAYSSFAALILLALSLAATLHERPRPRRIVLLGLVGLALPLTWSGGIAAGFVCSAGLVWIWLAARRSVAAADRTTGRIALAFAVGISVLALTCLVQSSRLRPAGFEWPSAKLFVTATLQCLSRGLGEPAALFRPIGSLIVFLLVCFFAFVLARRARDGGRAQIGAVGIALFGVAAIGSAALVGLRRGMDGDGSALFERYGLIAAPLWCAFGIAAAQAWNARAARALSWCVFVVVVLSFPFNFLAGERAGLARRSLARDLAQDLSSDVRIDEIVAKRWPKFLGTPDAFRAGLHDFEALGLGPFPNGAFRRPKVRPPPPFDMLLSAPLRDLGPNEVSVGEVGGARVLLVQDRKAVDFEIGPDPFLVRGTFGVNPDLGELESQTPVRFEVELVRLDGTRALLFARTLDPAAVPADRGEQHFRQRLDATAANGTVSVHATREGEPREVSSGFWRDILVR